MRNGPARKIAFGGVMAALALVIMCLGTLIPIATFVCPMLCAVLLMLVLAVAGDKIGWAWFAAVSVLSLLMAPDKEACAVFLFFGYYPIVKRWFDQRPVAWLWKFVYFNLSIFGMYGLLIWLLGLDHIAADFQELGMIMTFVTLVIGNVTLFMLDILLGRAAALIRRRG